LLIPSIGEQGQLRLKSAAVLLVGCGALGSPAAMYLAAAGVGRLGLVDADTVDASNLQRQILHGVSWVGKPKLDSALARPLNRFAYEDERDLCRLAAAYAKGIAQNHPFVDGNKRAALAVAGVFMMDNGWDLAADPALTAVAMLDLAAGDMTEEEFAAWLRDHTTPRNR